MQGRALLKSILIQSSSPVTLQDPARRKRWTSPARYHELLFHDISRELAAAVAWRQPPRQASATP